MEQIKNQKCPMCNKKALTLTEDRQEIPNYGPVYLFSMQCMKCKYHMSDVESEESHGPVKYTITVDSEKDMKIRVIKSSSASIKIPQMRMSVEPVGNSIGYVSNIEGLLNRFKEILEDQRDNADDPKIRKKAKNLLKKLWKVTLGDVPLKIIIEDPDGNSAIVSDKAEVVKKK